MIPDDPFIFNGYGALSNFDDHEARLSHLLGQGAMPILEGGRHIKNGHFWFISRVFIFTVFLQAMRGMKCVVFVESKGIRWKRHEQPQRPWFCLRPT
jgi:hypothetical protein